MQASPNPQTLITRARHSRLRSMDYDGASDQQHALGPPGGIGKGGDVLVDSGALNPKP